MRVVRQEGEIRGQACGGTLSRNGAIGQHEEEYAGEQRDLPHVVTSSSGENVAIHSMTRPGVAQNSSEATSLRVVLSSARRVTSFSSVAFSFSNSSSCFA
jgi:hypothetical protein